MVVPLALLALLLLTERLEGSLSPTLDPPHVRAARPTIMPRSRPVGAALAVGVLLLFAGVDVVTSRGRLGVLTDIGVVASSVTFAALVRPRRFLAAFLPAAALLLVAAAAGLYHPGLAHAPPRVWRAVIGDDVTDATGPLLAAMGCIAVAVALRDGPRLRLPVRRSGG